MNLYVYQASAVDTHLNNNWIIYPELFMNGKLSKQNTVNSGEMFPGLSEEYILVVYKICTHSLTILVLPWFRVFFQHCSLSKRFIPSEASGQKSRGSWAFHQKCLFRIFRIMYSGTAHYLELICKLGKWKSHHNLCTICI